MPDTNTTNPSDTDTSPPPEAPDTPGTLPNENATPNVTCSRCGTDLHPFAAFPGPSDGTRVNYLCDACFQAVVNENNTGTSAPAGTTTPPRPE